MNYQNINKDIVFYDSLLICVVRDTNTQTDTCFQIKEKTEPKTRISYISLNDIEKQLAAKFDLDKVVVTLIVETFKQGRIYRYNNYKDNTWYFHGTTNGFA